MPPECGQNAVRMPPECGQNAARMPPACRQNAARMPPDLMTYTLHAELGLPREFAFKKMGKANRGRVLTKFSIFRRFFPSEQR